ncbi:MAG: alcohol dehydrogenase catalytic domain-containing protein, partial [Actinomycetota bacterium]
MKAGRITVATRKFEVKDVPTPNAAKGEVRIKVGAAGVCLSDVHFLDGTLKPGYLQGDEVTLGHEVAGTIDQIGDRASNFKVGDRVLVIAGERNEKNQITTLGFDYDGGYAEYVIAKESLVVKIPDTLP